ncbi:DUF4153 domain-containing protein [Pseudonocardia sp. TMWB2A]
MKIMARGEEMAESGRTAATMRFDADDRPWPLRPWIMAAICAVAALLFHYLVDFDRSYVNGEWIAPPQWGVANGDLTPFRQALAVFVGVATLAFVLTVELRRWWWSLVFALGWALVIACVGYYTAGYNLGGEIVEFPFMSGVFAILLAAPLFQAARDMGARTFPYARTHNHIWNDAVIGAASLAFTGLSFLLVNLLAELFALVGMDFLRNLLNDEWFGWMIAGLAFGAAVGVLRERDALVSTMQRLVMVILSVLAPVLAVGLVLFLVSLPFTGLQKLWDTTGATTPILLGCAAGAFILANAVIGNGREERATNKLLQWAALALAVCILPLAIIAAISMGLRIEQYGWTPSRIWGMLVVGIAVGYGLSYLWAVIKGRKDWDDLARMWNLRGAIALVGIAVFLALPILDFGSISAKDQMARFKKGITSAHKFDYQAMAFDFGPKGREMLATLAKSDKPDIARNADEALKAEDRWSLRDLSGINERDDKALEERLVIEDPAFLAADKAAVLARLRGTHTCRVGPCTIKPLGKNSWVIFGKVEKQKPLRLSLLQKRQGKDEVIWDIESISLPINEASSADDVVKAFNPLTVKPDSKVELVPVERYRVVVDGMQTETYVDPQQ